MICSRCLMPSTRPRIQFTDGVCNACLHSEERKKIDWQERHMEFREVIAAHKKHPVYDCIVAFSGGKDSSSIAWRLKHEHGLNPLLVTYGQLLWTDVGRHNYEQVRAEGFDCLYWAHSQRASRSLARRFFIERGHPKQHYDAAVNAVPIRAAVHFGIPLVLFAEHGESFYGGLVRNEEARRTRDFAEVLENQVGDDPSNWIGDGITEKDLFTYTYPPLEDVKKAGVRAFYWSYFFPWDIYENAKLCREKMGFKTASTDYSYRDVRIWEKIPGKSSGTFEGFDSIDDMIDDLDYYMMWIKFGFGRATRMASRLIQGSHMTRDEGLKLVERFDGEYPRAYSIPVERYLGMSHEELLATIDLHRNPELWTKENGSWKLNSQNL